MAQLDRYYEAVAGIHATGTATHRRITVTRASDGDLDVRIRTGMLRRLTDDEIAAEIRGALLAALADHRRQYVQLRIDYFGSPVGAAPFTPAGITGRGQT